MFKREWQRNAKSLVIWSVVIGGLVLLTLSIFPQFAEQQKEVTKLLQSLPPAMIKAFGMDQLSIGDLTGYYGVRVYTMTTLLGSVYAAMLAANIVAKEENDKTIEFLLAKPVTRSEILTKKWLVVAVNILILNAVSLFVSFIGFQMAKEYDVSLKAVYLLTLATVLLHFTFASVAFLLSTIMRKTRNASSLALGLVFVTYFMNMMSSISDDLSFLKYVSPFKYVDAAPIINELQMDWLYTVLMIVIMSVSIIVAYVIYQKKDIVT
ncbi:ABC transporter permease [Anoxybacillus sp. LAT_38]|uniref:ABC transporter permease n=1 Tax=Anoxybacillus sp. LAT_26 TaxID=2862719 RepID=UPI001EEB6116|nr:ABC transporter permease [Anoxybacillus sp. LAT_26]MCG6182062.1 ABC transporter permease [Anoxybacillus sp. LAT_26]MCG6195986.1 ABC transporter permease [Anoxybacillus sp. LAT_38]